MLKQMVNPERVIMAHSRGKVGTTGIYNSLVEYTAHDQNTEILITHHLDRQIVHDLNTRQDARNQNSKRYHQLRGVRPQPKYLFITGFRDPVAVSISSIFQNMGSIFKRELTLKDLDVLLEKIPVTPAQFSFKYWYDKHFNDVLGCSLLDLEFDIEKGWGMTSLNQNVDVLIYTLETGLPTISLVVEDWLGISKGALKPFMGNAVDSKDDSKPYKNLNEISLLYKEVKKRFKLSGSKLDEIYSEPIIRHLYTQEDIKGFRGKWSK